MLRKTGTGIAVVDCLVKGLAARPRDRSAVRVNIVKNSWHEQDWYWVYRWWLTRGSALQKNVRGYLGTLHYEALVIDKRLAEDAGYLTSSDCELHPWYPLR